MAKLFLYVTLVVATATVISGAATPMKRQSSISADAAKFSSIIQQLVKSLKNVPAQSSNAGIFANVGDTCKADLTDPAYLTQCDTLKSYMVCYNDKKCGCLDLLRALEDIRDLLKEEEAALIDEAIQELKNSGLSMGTSYDATAKRCALQKDSICLSKEITAGQIGPIPGAQEIADSLNNLKCGTDMQCQSLNVPSDPYGLGQCIADDDDDDDDEEPIVNPPCVFEFSPDNVTDYLELCDVKTTNQVCYNDNKCGCYDTDKILTQLNLDADVKKALVDGYAALKGQGFSLTTSADSLSNNKCLLPKDAACPLGEIDLSKLDIDFDGIEEVSSILTNMKCAAELTCEAVDIANFPTQIGQCSGALNIVSGLALMLGSIFFSRIAFGF